MVGGASAHNPSTIHKVIARALGTHMSNYSPLERGAVGWCDGRGVLLEAEEHTPPPLSRGEPHNASPLNQKKARMN